MGQLFGYQPKWYSLKISYFVFSRVMKFIQVWNNFEGDDDLIFIFG